MLPDFIHKHWIIILIVVIVIAVGVFVYFAFFYDYGDEQTTTNTLDNADVSQTPATSSVPLSQRMNPGNLRNLKDSSGNPLVTYKGEVQPNSDAFKIFTDWPSGFRAMGMNLYAYLKRGLNSLNTIIPTYAPSADNNNPAVYINTVSSGSGIDPSQTLTKADFTNGNYKKIIYSMSKVEQGSSFDPGVGIDAGYTNLLNDLGLS